MRARARRPRRAVTGRALVLGTVVIVLLVLLASPLSRYFNSRSALTQAHQQLRSDQQELARLRSQKAQWSDPGYVQQQARQRLQLAMPGDTVYVVVDKGAKTEIEKTTLPNGGSAASGSWNTRIWASVQHASR
ncbi:MAG: septum formation initiator family protein [Jatrophihabitans sp.]|nr:MAG: septum formation initiator family protein [Jatrophihabitans sp.]